MTCQPWRAAVVWLAVALAAGTAPAALEAPGAGVAPTVRVAPAAMAAPAAGTSAAEIVAAYNRRDFGAPGWRRIVLELRSGEQVTRSFTVMHFFSLAGEEVRSLVVLEAPPGLRGTDYLLRESPGRPAGMDLFLRLPAGAGRVLRIVPSRFEEGLLGSDFTYSDLRWRISTRGWRASLAGRAVVAQRGAWVVDLRPESAETRQSSLYAVIRYYLGADAPLLLGTDYFTQPGAPPVKQMRTESATRIGGVWSPLRMVMSLAGGRSSVLTLRDARFGDSRFPGDLFTPERLPALPDWLAGGNLLPPLGGIQ
jgi:hypothetical protein